MPTADRHLRVQAKGNQIYYVRATYDEGLWGWVADVRYDAQDGEPWEHWSRVLATAPAQSFKTPAECLTHAAKTIIEVAGVDTVP